MARLIYPAIMSLDGYVADGEGPFEWAAPDEEAAALHDQLGEVPGQAGDAQDLGSGRAAAIRGAEA